MFDTSDKGKRVRLDHTNDQYTSLRPGDEGVVQFRDDWGQLCVRWDNGSTLSLIDEAGDRYTILA